jgi:hypothetical protein
VVQAGKYWGSIVAVFLLGWGYEALKHKGRPAAIRLALSIDTEVADDGKLYSTETGNVVKLGRFTIPHAVDSFMCVTCRLHLSSTDQLKQGVYFPWVDAVIISHGWAQSPFPMGGCSHHFPWVDAVTISHG